MFWLVIHLVVRCWLDADPNPSTAPTEAGDRMSTTTDEITGDSVRARLEAECRIAMAKVAAMQVRGFDTQRARDLEMADLDFLFDAYNSLAAP